MLDNVKNGSTAAPMLFPYEPAQFWQNVRQIIREEVQQAEKDRPASPVYETPGLTYKPLFKIAEVCSMFQVCRQTIYDWIKDGRLKPYKIKSRVYFLWNDIQQLLQPETQREGCLID
jgi:predicted DNA-binding transcriptional regulator AlpA